MPRTNVPARTGRRAVSRRALSFAAVGVAAAASCLGLAAAGAAAADTIGVAEISEVTFPAAGGVLLGYTLHPHSVPTGDGFTVNAPLTDGIVIPGPRR
ncbi:hypothetical protein ACN20G_31830 (plasmid) [Streptomyces sp. BI20]|uniref:hypothetical protein n=1 Tax=Streptomyces sp. BI20 TaxID=3403460 RepID=UPI003C762D10